MHDGGRDDSQFMTINLANESASVLGPKYKNYNFEGLDFFNDTLYASTGDEGKHNGKIYKVNIKTGAITLVGDTGFKGIVALAFNPNGRQLGWAEDQGLVEINTDNGSTRPVFSSKIGVEGLTWNKQGTALYASAGKKLYVYNFSEKKLVKVASNLPGNTEALEMRPDGMLLSGWHNGDSVSIFVYDPIALRVVAEDNITVPYNDIEGIAWPNDC